jgi:hypothetical protein
MTTIIFHNQEVYMLMACNITGVPPATLKRTPTPLENSVVNLVTWGTCKKTRKKKQKEKT